MRTVCLNRNHNRPLNSVECPNREAGVALLMVLFVMVLLGVLGITITSSAISESRMSGNYLDQDVAFQSAETALRAGEGYVSSFQPNLVPLPAANCAAPCIALLGSLPANPWGTPQAANVAGIAGIAGVAGAAAAPEYTVEFSANVVMQGSSLGLNTGNPPPTINFFQVTARGTGRSNVSQAVIQSMFAW